MHPASELTSLSAGAAVLSQSESHGAGTAGAAAPRAAARRRQTQVRALAVHGQAVVGAVRLPVRVVDANHQREMHLPNTEI